MFLDKRSDDLESSGILMQGVDTLPAELPKEATDHFGDHLMPLLPNLIDSDGNLSLEEQQAQLNPSWHVLRPLSSCIAWWLNLNRRDNQDVLVIEAPPSRHITPAFSQVRCDDHIAREIDTVFPVH